MAHDRAHHGHSGLPGGEAADWTDQLAALEREGEMSASWVREAIGWLGSLSAAPIREVIDIGSGPGVAAVLLGHAFPAARITAFDANAAFLDRAAERAESAGLGDRFDTRRGHIGPEMAGLPQADLIWASRVLHHLDDPTAGLALLGGLLRPPEGRTGDAGGLLALAEGGLPMRVLPGGYGVGDPGLVARLDAAVADHATHRWGMTEAASGGTSDWPLLVAEAGLRHVATRSFLLDLPAPLDDRAREFVEQRFDLDPELVERLSPADAAALARLTDPDDPAALRNRPDLFLLTAQTVHVARRV